MFCCAWYSVACPTSLLEVPSAFLRPSYTEQTVSGQRVDKARIRCDSIDFEATHLFDWYAATCRVQGDRALFHCRSVAQFSVSLANNVDLCTHVNNHHQFVFLCVILQESLTINSLVHAPFVDADRVCGELYWHVFVEFRQARSD